MKYKFICPIFRDEVTLIVGSKFEAEKFCSGLELTDNHQGKCLVIKDKDDGTIGYLVWIIEPQLYHTMVHETLHLVRFIFEAHAVPFNSENDEIIAYYQNYWVRTFWNKMSTKQLS